MDDILKGCLKNVLTLFIWLFMVLFAYVLFKSSCN